MLLIDAPYDICAYICMIYIFPVTLREDEDDEDVVAYRYIYIIMSIPSPA